MTAPRNHRVIDVIIIIIITHSPRRDDITPAYRSAHAAWRGDGSRDTNYGRGGPCRPFPQLKISLGDSARGGRRC